ncbi:MAG TPA: hypothetical protein VF240_20920 [Pyrinomonadaceae bacterium]
MSEEEKKKVRRRVVVPRQLLLVEVERYCRDPQCRARTGVGLTKEEARTYDAFTCARCEQKWDDALTERDIPEWWEELRITSLDARRSPALRPGAEEASEGPVTRMSDAWRARSERGDREADGEGASDGEDSL